MSYAMFNAAPAEGNHKRMVQELGKIITPPAMRTLTDERDAIGSPWITLIPPGSLRRHMDKKPTGIEFIEAKEVEAELGLLDLKKLHDRLWLLQFNEGQQRGYGLEHVGLNVFGKHHSMFVDEEGILNNLNVNSIGVILYLATFGVAENIVGPIALTWFDTREREIEHGHI